MSHNAAAALAHTKAMTGSEWVRKSLKERSAADPMRMLGGSPTRVAAPAMLASIA